MQRLFVSGPGQNIDWSQHGVERGLPHLFADCLNMWEAMARGGQYRMQVQLWNNNTPITVGEWGGSGGQAGFNRYCAASVRSKLTLLRQHGYQDVPGGTKIVTDTDPAVTTWVQQKLRRLLSAGAVYVEQADFQVCGDCGNIIAEAAAERVQKCKLCTSSRIGIQREKALFANFPSNRRQLFDGRFCGPVSATVVKELSNRFKLLPPRVFINKRREAGIALDSLGFPGFVVDPKVAIALLPEYAAATLGVDELVQIQGITTATNTIPYTTLFNGGGYKNTYLFIQKAPRGILAGLGQGTHSLYGHLVAQLMGRNSPMKPNEYELLLRDHQKVAASIAAAMQRFAQPDAIGEVSLRSDATQQMAAIRAKLLACDYAEAIKLVRQFVNKTLVPVYARECKQERKRLAKSDYDVLRLLLGVLYV